MKKIFLMATSVLFIIGCNSNSESTAGAGKDSATTTMVSTDKIDYAYLPANHPPDNWDRGDQHNVALVLKSLKAWASKDSSALESFADSVQWQADGMDQKMSKDEMRKRFNDYWGQVSSINIKMDDYETVVSKDKKDNWVSLWYKQITTDKSGKVDSVYCMDDLKIDNGKITVLDEKTRNFPAPKK
ncbi:MAG: hypothetical protein JSU05_12050 [Bacteroidetes bacterium]|nr:hypothetical protein [Bacteroidota bacterium]